MARQIKHLKKEQLEALGLFHQFTLGKNFKTKKAKYQEIATRLEQKPRTVETWINRWYEKYVLYLKELKQQGEKLQKNFTLKGLTKKQTLYVLSRLQGKSKEESKLVAGYSEKTEVSKIENNPKVIKSMSQLRKDLINDTKLGAAAILNDLMDISQKGRIGVDEVKIIEEHGAEGKKHKREIRKVKHLGVSVQALSKVASILGYDSYHQEQLQQRNKEFIHKKNIDKKDQERADQKLDMDIEKHGLNRDKIKNGEDQEKTSVAELRKKHGM